MTPFTHYVRKMCIRNYSFSPYLPINRLQSHSSKVYLSDALLVKSITFQSDELYQRCLSPNIFRSIQFVTQLTTFLFILPFLFFSLLLSLLLIFPKQWWTWYLVRLRAVSTACQCPVRAPTLFPPQSENCWAGSARIDTCSQNTWVPQFPSTSAELSALFPPQ
jgi:hypothetical protein